MNRQGGGKGQMHLKATQPLKTLRSPVTGACRIIADRAPVVDDKPVFRFLRQVVRNLLILRIGEGVGMDPRKMRHIKKPFNLTACKAIDKRRAGQLLKSVVCPVRHGR